MILKFWILHLQHVWCTESGSEFTGWGHLLTEAATSEWASFWKTLPYVPGVPRQFSGKFPRVVPGCKRTCEVRINSPSVDTAPSIRLFAPQNSRDTVAITLPSIFLETCVTYCSLTLWVIVSRNKLFLGRSSRLSLLTAVNFLLFFNGEWWKNRKCWGLDWFFIVTPSLNSVEKCKTTGYRQRKS